MAFLGHEGSLVRGMFFAFDWSLWRQFENRPRRCAAAILPAVLLIVLVYLGSASSCIGATAVQIRVAAGTDDAEEWSASGSMYVNSTDLELAIDGTTSNTVGIRFTSVAVPQGATITNAYIQFKTDESSSGACSLTFRGEAADNAAGFTLASSNISSRATTSASVAWSPSNWNTVGIGTI